MTCAIVSGAWSVTRPGRYRETVDVEISVRGVVYFPKGTGAALEKAQLLMEKGREVFLVVPSRFCRRVMIILGFCLTPFSISWLGS
jgi:hypothetical protein